LLLRAILSGGGGTRPILIVPGYRDSGPGHWQTLFERKLPGTRRVRMPSFDEPEPEGWVAALDAAIAAAPAPPGRRRALARLHRPRALGGPAPPARARRALVAPADVEKSRLPAPVRAFAPIPTEALPFPSILVASTNDPYLELVRAQSLASSWDASLTVVEDRGHLNVDSGHGSWLDGELF
jgi:predicted alpha/beta hydrolase family esterase